MPRVTIDCFHEHLAPVPAETAIMAVDVIRATTTAITAVTLGWRLYPAGSIEVAVRLAADLDQPMLAGELGGVQPYGFDLQNSPVQIGAGRVRATDHPAVDLRHAPDRRGRPSRRDLCRLPAQRRGAGS